MTLLEEVARVLALGQEEETCRVDQLRFLRAHGEELLAALRDASLWRKHISKRSTWRREFEKAPCFICGYNGAGYYQPDTHKCAEQYHAAMKEAK